MVTLWASVFLPFPAAVLVGSVAGVEGLSPVVLAALLFAPLVLHGFATTVAAVGASRDRTYYALTLALATLLHAAYNFGVVSVHG